MNRELSLQDARRAVHADHGMAFNPLCPIDHNTLMSFHFRDLVSELPKPAHCNDIPFEVDADGIVRDSSGKQIEMRYDRTTTLEEMLTIVVDDFQKAYNARWNSTV